MTSSMQVSLVCPKCGEVGEGEVWTSVGNVESPDAAQWLIDGFLFQYECPACGHRSALNHDCLFNDEENKVMILHVADSRKAEEALAVLDSRKPRGYRIRLVATLDELREKAAIFRDGLDDRAVEVVKQAACNRLVASGEVPRDARVLYGARDGDDIIVEFVAESSTTETTVPADVYRGVADSFTDVQPAVVDRAWAMSVLSQWGPSAMSFS